MTSADWERSLFHRQSSTEAGWATTAPVPVPVKGFHSHTAQKETSRPRPSEASEREGNTHASQRPALLLRHCCSAPRSGAKPGSKGLRRWDKLRRVRSNYQRIIPKHGCKTPWVAGGSRLPRQHARVLAQQHACQKLLVAHRPLAHTSIYACRSITGIISSWNYQIS